jgi:hypothetical protein
MKGRFYLGLILAVFLFGIGSRNAQALSDTQGVTLRCNTDIAASIAAEALQKKILSENQNLEYPKGQTLQVTVRFKKKGASKGFRTLVPTLVSGGAITLSDGAEPTEESPGQINFALPGDLAFAAPATTFTDAAGKEFPCVQDYTVQVTVKYKKLVGEKRVSYSGKIDYGNSVFQIRGVYTK